jgi:hypothetical protein
MATGHPSTARALHRPAIQAHPQAISRKSDKHRHRKVRNKTGRLILVSIVMVALVTAVAALLVRLSPLPLLREVVYVVWLVPLAELALLILGQLYYRFGFRTAPGKFRLLIIQVTTTGKEQARVNEIIASLRSYALPMEHQIWVVAEPGHENRYPQADRVLIVPTGFTPRSERKGRALEYSRQVREAEGLDTPWVKILYNDDDVLPTQSYVLTAFDADYDVCEGITAPRTEYAVWPLSHVVASHADDIRTRTCLIYCSVFQGVLGNPLYVHGEGLTVTGEAERIVTWDRPGIAEDLTFGQNAASMGLRWGWFHEHVELTSPWTLREFLIQRRRWLWGNIDAIAHRDALPLPRALAVASTYVVNTAVMLFSMTGIAMKLTGALPTSSPVYDVAKLALLTWLAVFFGVGWIGASGRVDGRNEDSRLLNALMAVVFSPLSCLVITAGLAIPLLQGNPRTFEVIQKTRNSLKDSKKALI